LDHFLPPFFVTLSAQAKQNNNHACYEQQDANPCHYTYQPLCHFFLPSLCRIWCVVFDSRPLSLDAVATVQLVEYGLQFGV
jgi:hypothetical protein